MASGPGDGGVNHRDTEATENRGKKDLTTDGADNTDKGEKILAAENAARSILEIQNRELELPQRATKMHKKGTGSGG